MDRKAQVSMAALSPKRAENGTNRLVPTSAPILPLAAATPLNVVRQSRENVMDGNMNVYSKEREREREREKEKGGNNQNGKKRKTKKRKL